MFFGESVGRAVELALKTGELKEVKADLYGIFRLRMAHSVSVQLQIHRYVEVSYDERW